MYLVAHSNSCHARRQHRFYPWRGQGQGERKREWRRWQAWRFLRNTFCRSGGRRFAGRLAWHVEWTEEFRHLPEAIITFQIDALGDVVRLRVSEFHPEGIDENYLEGGRRGWPIILSGLKSLLEAGRPLPKFELPDMPTE